MRARSAALLALSATLIVADAAPLSAADPQLSLITPRGARRGTEATFEFSGNRLGDAAEVLFYDPGFAVTKIEPDKKRGDKKVNVTVAIAPDVRVGEHLVQLRCANGLTEFATIWAGQLPEVAEVEPNGELDAPQALGPELFEEAGGVTLTGTVDKEDLDHFAVELAEGQTLSVEVEGLRLASKDDRAMDPAIALLNTAGRELVASDDTALTAADPALHFVAPTAGVYVLRIRDAEFKGDSRGFYRAHVGVRPEAFPRPMAVYPAGGPVGEPTEVTFLGDAAGPFTQTVVPEFGKTADQTGHVYATRGDAVSPTPLPFRASTFPNVLEAEPNDVLAEATPGPDAVDGRSWPLAFNGILSEPGDVDCFSFHGKKNQTLRFDAYGRRIGSAIDPEIDIYGPDDKLLKSGSDREGLDPREDYKLPADGLYKVRVRDHLERGGPLFVYRLEVSPAVRTPTLSIPRYGRYGQGRQRIAVPRGGRFATRVTVSRDGLGEELQVGAAELPEGVTLVSPPMPSNQSTWPVVFAAAEDAPLSGVLSDLRAYPAEKPEMLSAGPEQRAGYASSIITGDLVRYNNNGALWAVDAPAVAVAVVEKLPFSIEVLPPSAPLVQNGSLELQIKVHRDEGFDGDIKLEFPQRTSGVGCDYQRTVKKGEDAAVYPLNANSKAALGTFPFYVLAFAGLPNELNGIEYGGGTGTCGSELVDVTITEAPFSLKLAKGSVQRTTSTALTATLESAEFVGTATVTLKGLPDGLTCEPVEVTQETESFVFQIAATEKAPKGTRKGLVAEVVLPNVNEAGETVEGARVFTAGTTDLRVDDAPPAPKTEPAPKPETKPEPKVAKAPAQPKPLSRLERLRREAAGLPTDDASTEGDTNK